MDKIIRDLSDKIPVMSGVTIGGSAVGTGVKEFGNSVYSITLSTDLLSLLQYGAYSVSIIVGVLTVITWCKKNRREKKRK